MATISLNKAKGSPGELFDQANTEPVVVTDSGKPTHVVLPAELCDKLTTRLGELEDRAWGNRAIEAINLGNLIGSDQFEERLRAIIANGEH